MATNTDLFRGGSSVQHCLFFFGCGKPMLHVLYILAMFLALSSGGHILPYILDVTIIGLQAITAHPFMEVASVGMKCS